ncbi:MAG: serine/threonine-protein kinase [Myxococcota bacterium]
MTPERHQRLMQLFDEACELSPEGARAFVDRLPAGDDDVRQQLSQMLEVDRRSQVFFDETRGAKALLARDLLESAIARSPAPADPGPVPQRIGEYEILERLGSGGMGTVYRARQAHPDRVVALKTVHPWLVSPATLERFRFEAQALASLRHPFIPPVYAVGQHEGVVWLSMELVSGPTLSQWAREKQPPPSVRIELLAKVCDAVHHAHLRGFVHRDLKPDNLRVLEDGTPRVLDFGIAAGLGDTRVEVAGTPAYMAPEQLIPGSTVDVRTDVYGLGVIAFELLTGRLPTSPAGSPCAPTRNERGQARAAPQPGFGLATLEAAKRQAAPSVAAADPKLRGDLEHIVAKALAVDPTQRYASAADLASDLRRHLACEPVTAHPGGAWYRLRRFVQRRRWGVATAALIFTTLLVGTVVSLVQYQKAEAAFERADAEARRARAALDFVISVLKQGDPEKAGRDVTVRQAVERAARLLDDGALEREQPLVASAVRSNLAETFMGLGDWQAADAQVKAALAIYERAGLGDDELLAQTLLLAAQVHHEAGRGEEAIAAGLRAIETEKRLHPGEHPHVSYALHVQAVSLREAGHLEEALIFHAQGLEMERALVRRTGRSEDLADALNQHAVTLAYLGRYDEAEPRYREALELDLKQFGARHPEVATDYHHLAWLENERDNPAAAKAWLAKALDIRAETLGLDHVRVGVQRNLEAYVELALGNVAGADAAEDECLRISERAYGKAHARYTRAEQARIRIRVAQGRFDEAIELGRRLSAFHAQRYGATHWVTAATEAELGGALVAKGDLAEGVAVLERAVAVLVKSLGESSKLARDARRQLAQARQH